MIGLRTFLLSSVTLPLVMAAAPAQAQSGSPGPGTTLGPPAVNTTAGSPNASGSPVAQTPDDQRDAGALQDVIVTARRTSERLQSTPVAVTALVPEMLLQKQVADVIDLQRVAPSLSIGTGGIASPTSIFLSIRGQSQSSPNSYSDSPVGIYMDGVYVARPIVGNLGFLDPASVEVLRGPQGTLFGRNTTGGALNLTSAQPTENFEGYIKAGYGNYDARRVEGVLNVPLTGDLALRVAARYGDHDGYYPSAYQNTRLGRVNGDFTTRASVKWTPSGTPLTWVVSGDYSRYSDNGNGVALTGINPTGLTANFYTLSQGVRSGAVPGTTPIPIAPGLSLPASLFANFSTGPLGVPITAYLAPDFSVGGTRQTSDPFTVFATPQSGVPQVDRLHNYAKGWSATSNLVVDLDAVTIKSITGYRKSRATNAADFTEVPVAVGGFFSDYHQHQISQELQLSGKAGALSYIAGLYYFREKGTEQSDVALLYGSPFAIFQRVLGGYTSRSIGAFAQVNYQLSDRLRATGGIRYTWDRRSFTGRNVNNYRVPDPVCSIGPNTGKPASQAVCLDSAAASFSYPAWTAGIDYKITDDIFVYAKTSGASNSGGFNNRGVPPGASTSFRPEDVRDVEGGFKGEFLDRHLRTNLAVFHTWQHDAQRVVNTTFLNPATNQQELTQFVSNAGDVRIRGVEFETDIVPWQGMTLSGNVGYLNGKYVRGTRVENQLLNGAVVRVDRSGEPLLQTPEWTANVSATQDIRFDAGKLTLHADYAYIDDRAWDSATTPDPTQRATFAAGNAASIVRGYGLLSGSIGFTLDAPAIEIIAYARNLTSKAYYTSAFNSYTGLGFTSQGIGAPRTYGATLAYRF